MINDTQKLVAEMEAVAAALGISPSTVGERAGQGGMFYKRLKSGKRAWPETVSSVRERMRAMQSDLPVSGECEVSHMGDASTVQGGDA